MKKIKYLTTILILSFLVFAGCAATTPQILEAMDPWKGQHIDALLMKWGTPSNVYDTQSGEYTIYTWIYQGGTQVFANYVPSINMAFASAQDSYCRFDWTTDKNGRILEYRWEGRCRIIR